MRRWRWRRRGLRNVIVRPCERRRGLGFTVWARDDLHHIRRLIGAREIDPTRHALAYIHVNEITRRIEADSALIEGQRHTVHLFERHIDHTQIERAANAMTTALACIRSIARGDLNVLAGKGIGDTA